MNFQDSEEKYILPITVLEQKFTPVSSVPSIFILFSPVDIGAGS